MDIGNVKVNQASVYATSDAANTKAETKEADAKAVSTDAEAASFKADGGRTYSASATRTGYAVDTETIDRLKSENEERMMNLVRKILGEQVEKADMAGLISKDSVMNAIKAGKFTQEDVEQAKKDTAEDGYWGVEQTSDRFVQYATALTGGDPDKLDAMIEAFEKGYAEAEKQWGGELPELAQRTREATLKKFQELKDQYAEKSGPVAQAAQTVLEAKVQKAMNETD